MMRASRASAAAAEAVASLTVWPLLRTGLARTVVPQLSRYTIVSAVALGLDCLVFFASTHGAGLRASLAGIVGYSTGLVLHFVLSTWFVFDTGAAAKSKPRLFAEFAASGLIGLAITAGVIALAVDIAALPAVIGKAGAVVISFACVFMLRRTIVFAARQGADATGVARGPSSATTAR